MSKVGVHIIGGVLVIPLTRGTNPCIGLAVSQDPRAPRVWGSTGHARAPLRVNSLIQPKPTSKGPQRVIIAYSWGPLLVGNKNPLAKVPKGYYSILLGTFVG